MQSGYKDKVEGDRVKKGIAIHIILSILFGKSSKLYKELTSDNTLIGEFDTDYEMTENYAHVIISGSSRDPEKVINKMKEEVENLKKNGFTDEEFSRNKKKVYGGYISEYNSVEETARSFMTNFFRGINSFDYLEKYESVTKEYTKQILDEVFKEDKRVYTITK